MSDAPRIPPHTYEPDYEAMGDCRMCGHVADVPWHILEDTRTEGLKDELRSLKQAADDLSQQEDDFIPGRCVNHVHLTAVCCDTCVQRAVERREKDVVERIVSEMRQASYDGESSLALAASWVERHWGRRDDV